MRLARVWSACSHLWGVSNTEDWRKAYNACIPKLSDYATEVGQNVALYQAYQSLADAPDFAGLEPAQQKLIRDALRDFRLTGVALPAESKDRFNFTQKMKSHFGKRTFGKMMGQLLKPRNAKSMENGQSKKEGGDLLNLSGGHRRSPLTVFADRSHRARVELFLAKRHFRLRSRLFFDVGKTVFIFREKFRCSSVANVASNTALTARIIGVSGVPSAGNIFFVSIIFLRHIISGGR